MKTLLQNAKIVVAVVIVLAIPFVVGYAVGTFRQTPQEPLPSAGERLTTLHAHMAEPYVRWSWKQHYCGKKP